MKKTEVNTYFRVAGEYKNRWWLRPICWVLEHLKLTISPYGLWVHQCKRCGKTFWRRKRKGEDNIGKFFNGEIGMLYGVRFVEDEKMK